MKSEIKNYIEQNREQVFQTIKELCEIPAPSHFEHKRALFCKSWLESVGAKGVYIDEAQNVIFPLNCENSSEITVLAAHTDTVFPDVEPMPYFDDGEKIHSPGVADDTSSVVVLLYTAKYFIQEKILPPNGIMFVFNSCEEGLGNLKGITYLFDIHQSRIKNFITFDSNLDVISDRCVGSHRYEVEVFTEGGHSFESFGNKNAIFVLSDIINKIYQIEVPQKQNTQTTYNVGTISGGTSVNTIAQYAKALCEYRSNDYECLLLMQNKFEKIFSDAQKAGAEIKVTTVGKRPCGNIEQSRIEELKNYIVPIYEAVLGKKVILSNASTDCNIPLSLGIPALCVGANIHNGIHTREEWVDKTSVLTGLEIAIKVSVALMNS